MTWEGEDIQTSGEKAFKHQERGCKGPEVGASMLSEANVDGMKVSSSEGCGVDNGLNH